MTNAAHMREPESASFKGPFSFKDREVIPLSTRMFELNKLYEIAIAEQEQIKVEMTRLVAASRSLQLPLFLRTKASGGVHPSFQLAEPRSRREQVIKLIWIGRSAGKQVKCDPVPFVVGSPELADVCAQVALLNMRMRIALCQSTTARESISEMRELLGAAHKFAA